MLRRFMSLSLLTSMSIVFPGSSANAVAPEISTCAVNSSGTAVTLTFNSPISNSSLPARTSFSLNESGNLRLVRSVDTTTTNVTSTTIRLSAATIYQGETITVSYTNPGGANSLRNSSGEQVTSFNCPSVTNNSTVNLIIALDSTSDSYSSGDVWQDLTDNNYDLNINGNPVFTAGDGFNFNQTLYTPNGTTRYPNCHFTGATRATCVNHVFRPTFPSIGSTWSMFAWVRANNVSPTEQIISTMSRCPDGTPNGANNGGTDVGGAGCANTELIWGIDDGRLYAWDYENQYLGVRACAGTTWTTGCLSTNLPNARGGRAGPTYWRSSATLQANTWYYLGIVRNTTSTTAGSLRTTYSMYINGNLDNQITTDTNLQYGNDNLNIGADWRDNARQFNGTIKSFYVYDSVVDAAVALNEFTSSLVTFGSLNDQLFERDTLTVAASTSSTSALSYATSGQCTNSGTTISFSGAGNCIVTASAEGGMVDRSFTIINNLDLNTPPNLPVYPPLKNLNISSIPIRTNNSNRVYFCLDIVATSSSTTPISASSLNINFNSVSGDTVTVNSSTSKVSNSTIANARNHLSSLTLASSTDRLMKYNSGSYYLLIRANLIADPTRDAASCNNFDDGARKWIQLYQTDATSKRRTNIPLVNGKN